MMTGAEILALEMGDNDAGAKTVRGYLKELLTRLWEQGEGFSGKRPFGNSGWEHNLEVALVKGGAVQGALDEDGYVEKIDGNAVDVAMNKAIEAL